MRDIRRRGREQVGIHGNPHAIQTSGGVEAGGLHSRLGHIVIGFRDGVVEGAEPHPQELAPVDNGRRRLHAIQENDGEQEHRDKQGSHEANGVKGALNQQNCQSRRRSILQLRGRKFRG